MRDRNPMTLGCAIPHHPVQSRLHPSARGAGINATDTCSVRMGAKPRPLLTRVLVVVSVAGVASAMLAFRIGSTPLGAAAPIEQACLYKLKPALAIAPGHQYAVLKRVEAEQTWLPLGIVCRLTASGSEAATGRAFQSWPATVACMGGAALALLSLLLLPSVRRRH